MDKKKIEKLARKGHKFTLESGIASQSSGIFKGASPIPQIVQLKTEINLYIRDHVQDSDGILKKILERKVSQSDLLILENMNKPLLALKNIVEQVLRCDESLFEFVRQIDQDHGMTYQERPHFQSPGQEAHPDDEYTHESVLCILKDLLVKLQK